jgi:16S rRNA (cytidine1402-2'-O)-methyltransferase
MSKKPTPGCLYVVATPIGNLHDISQRAKETLAAVDAIAAEDTRHSGRLLAALGITTPMLALHEHNEEAQVERLIERLEAGQSLALISDAGTPLISDPGFALIRALRERKLPLVPIPGPNAAIAALSAAGLPTDRFVFAGFPPRTGPARRGFFEELADGRATLVFYESCHRLDDCLADMCRVFGGERQAVLAREITKLHETFVCTSLAELAQRVGQDADQRRGEMVVLVAGNAQPKGRKAEIDTGLLLERLLAELPLKKAVALAAELSGLPRNQLYEQALLLKELLNPEELP